MSKGLSLEHKLLIFFDEIFIAMFSGFNYFKGISGITKQEKRNYCIVLSWYDILDRKYHGFVL